jgi:hypothetical protein
MRELNRRQSNKSKKAEVVNYYYQRQNLKPGEKRQRGASQFQSKHQKGQRRKLLGKVLQEWFVSLVSRDKNELSCFVSINRMRTGHSSLKASLSRINIVSAAECECDDGLQTEEHISWDCKLYEVQRATVTDILYKNSKKEYPKSVTELSSLWGKKFCAGRLLLHKQNS